MSNLHNTAFHPTFGTFILFIFVAASALAQSIGGSEPSNDDSAAHEEIRRLSEDTQAGLDSQLTSVRSMEDYQSKLRDYGSAPRDAGEARFIVEYAQWAVAGESPDWPTLELALGAARVGMRGYPELVEVAEGVFHAPRGEKISDSHAKSLSYALEMLGYLDDPAAIDLLVKCTEDSFWSEAPVRSPHLSTLASHSRTMLRTRAYIAIAQSRADLGLPVLEKMGEEHPNLGRPVFATDENYRLEDELGLMIAMLLWEVRTREGLEAGENPREAAIANALAERGIDIDELREQAGGDVPVQ